MTTGSADPLHVAARVAAALEALDIAYSIGGSLAGSFAGEPRATLDIDMVVALGAAQVPALIRALENDFYIDSEALHRAVIERGTTNLIHQPTSIKVDMFIAGGTPLDEELLHRRVRLRDQDLWVHSPGHPAAKAAMVQAWRGRVRPPVARRVGYRPRPGSAPGS